MRRAGIDAPASSALPSMTGHGGRRGSSGRPSPSPSVSVPSAMSQSSGMPLVLQSRSGRPRAKRPAVQQAAAAGSQAGHQQPPGPAASTAPSKIASGWLGRKTPA